MAAGNRLSSVMLRLPALERLPRPLQVIAAALKQWSAAEAGRHGAALAYYTLFALAPMLVIVIAVAGAVYGEEAVRGEVVGQLNGLVGQDGAELIESLLRNARKGDQGILAAVLGGLTFVLGATGAFVQLQGALNHIWGVKAEPGRNLVRYLFNRAQSFGMLIALGFILMVSLAVDAALSAAAAWTEINLPGIPILNVLNGVVSLGVLTALFALIYRVLPDVQLRWRDVGYGAVITAVLFTVGKRLIGLYLGETSMASAYGAAGSVVIVMVWVFYSAQVVLLGAAITKVGFGGEPKRRKPTEIARKE
jgi:membrane protein